MARISADALSVDKTPTQTSDTDSVAIPSAQEHGPEQFALHRRQWAAWAARAMARAALLVYHRLFIEGEQHLPLHGPALVLPKHCAYRDILVEGVFLHRIGRRYGNYVMKVGLAGPFEAMGGVKIVRPKDITRAEDRQERRRRLAWAREKNEQTMTYLSWLYQQGELVVSHPEGMRTPGRLGALQGQVVEHLRQVEEASGLSIPMIPVGLEYENIRSPRSAVFARLGEPMYSQHYADTQELLAEMTRRLQDLSFRL